MKRYREASPKRSRGDYTIAGQQIALRDADETYYLVTDHLGSVVSVLDGTGAQVYEQRYRPFGQPRLSTSGSPTDRGFTGQRELGAAGFADFNARWFDTSLGGFASPDSIIADPFSPQSLNRYGYVLNNPLRYTDPTGHRACDDFDAGGRCVTAPPAPRTTQATTVSAATAVRPRNTSQGGGGTSTPPVVTPTFTPDPSAISPTASPTSTPQPNPSRRLGPTASATWLVPTRTLSRPEDRCGAFDTFVDAYDLIPSSELPCYPPNFEDPLAMVEQAVPPGAVVVVPVPLPNGKVVEFAVDPRAAIEALREGLFGTVTFFRHGGVREWLGVLRYLPYEPVHPSLELEPVPTPGP